MSVPAVRIEGLRFTRPGGFRLAVEDLAVASGERLALVGPSGSGKTTLLALLAGILVPDAGRVLVGDTDVAALPDARRRAFRARHVGLVFQGFELVDYLSARENILYPYRIAPDLALDAEARAYADALGRSLCLGALLDRRPGALSQGERARVALARALVTRPGLVLADEATGNLDPDGKARALDLLFERTAETGASVIAATHDHALLDRFDRAIDVAAFARAEAA
ncbi:MAG: ABC transporter ATP-binding protein [Paracoccaceae bacterium]